MRSAERRLEALRRHHLEEMTGADLTKLPGLDLLAVERILSEIGLDMSRWPSEKHFCAWLNVVPLRAICGRFFRIVTTEVLLRGTREQWGVVS
jgi:transposase